MEQLSYEEASSELAEIINKIENNNLSLNEADTCLKRGEELIQICYKLLDKSKGKLTEIKEVLGKLEEE